jgi:hypothetical protein
VLLAFLGYASSYRAGYRQIEAQSRQVQSGLSYLLHYATASDENLALLAWNPNIPRELAPILEALREGPFLYQPASSIESR